MTKRSRERTPRDSGWINLEEPREVRYWTTALAVSEARLRTAVRAAGDATIAVRQYLGGHQDDDASDNGNENGNDGSLRQLAPPPTGRSSSTGSQQQG